MKKFKFGLDVILKLKESKEEECRINLGQITAESEKIRRDINDRRNILLTTGISSCPDDFYAVEFYKNRISNEIAIMKKELIKNEEKREKAKAEYIEAMSQLSIYQKLKEKKYKEYKKEKEKVEVKFLDEMNQRSGNRRGIIYGN